MKELPVEERLKTKLEAIGFKVLKLVTPGNTGAMDRLILRPKWSPGAPYACEVKRPGKEPTRKQELLAEDWAARGMQVLPPVSTYAEVDETVSQLAIIARGQRIDRL